MQNPSEKQVYLLADISSMLYDSTKLKNVRKYATMTTKMVFHGSDIEKICSYYHLNKEDIIKFGANVNPLGLSSSVREATVGSSTITGWKRRASAASFSMY